MSFFYREFISKALFFIVALSPFWCFGQLDSLLQVAENAPDGEEKIDTWLEIAKLVIDTDIDRCLLYCDSIDVMAKRHHYELGINKSTYLRSSSLYRKGENVDALPLGQKALEYAFIEQDTHQLIARHNNLGMIYSELELFDKASEHLLACSKLSEASGKYYTAAVSYYNLSTVFFDLDNMVNAKKYILLAIDLLEKNNNYSIHCVLINALASVVDDEEEAYQMQLEALRYCEENETPYFLTPIYNNLGTDFQDKKNYAEALKYYHLALKYAQDYDNAEFITHASGNIGNVFMIKNQLDSALYYSLMSLEIAEENDYLYNQQKLYNQLGELYVKKQDFQKAYEYGQKAFNVRDSIYESNIEQQLQINADQFQLERKEKQIAEQNLELSQAENSKNRMIIIGILLLSLIVAIYQWYLYQQQKRKQAADLKLSLEQAESLRLRELDKMKTNFFTNISHELRTPLTLILSPIADIMEAIASKPIRDKLGIVQRNGQRLLNLVNEIMDLSKVEVGKLEFHQSEVPLNAFIKRVFSSFESLADIRRIRYQLKLNIEDTTVLLDRDKFEKILHNLLSNAIKYTGAGGEIYLEVSKNADQYLFNVKDSGQGIHPDDQVHVFDRYYQAQNSNQAMQGGTGIGLALAKELAQLLGGDIKMESSLNKGSSFCLSLPLETVHKSQKSELPEEHPTTPSLFVPSYAPIHLKGEKPKVLVVEDHPEMGKYILEILSDHYQCVLATDGTQALKQMKLSSFDCITSDVMMPNMDGFMLRQKINEQADWKQIPFLLLTARQLEEDKIKGFQLGIDDYITKPFSTRELHARIHNLISNKLERDSYQQKEEKPLSVDQSMLINLEQAVLDHLDDEQFKVENLATIMHYSTKQIGRIIKKHTGLSSVQFILEVRLQKAREMLEKRLCSSVIEVQYAVGIQSTSYFTRKFTERFGKNPSSFF